MTVCKDHPKYKTLLKPKNQCFACWRMWLDAHPLRTLPTKDIIQLFKVGLK